MFVCLCVLLIYLSIYKIMYLLHYSLSIYRLLINQSLLIHVVIQWFVHLYLFMYYSTYSYIIQKKQLLHINYIYRIMNVIIHLVAQGVSYHSSNVSHPSIHRPTHRYVHPPTRPIIHPLSIHPVPTTIHPPPSIHHPSSAIGAGSIIIIRGGGGAGKHAFFHSR